ncbi:EKC/KEOPS complex subunit GON7 [Podospora australis]|uniref:EKC/KEOPS complex subunit GON7 n=1 Tax=Podospora australis TaxID=1536484 RepID=A0AAN6WMN5_9PEZI|nr:EKC/KEOPS complex subunit GON7 [Podospora australis]
MSSTTALSASYTSKTDNAPFTIELPLTAPKDSSVASKTEYLNKLRESAISMQERVNKELTQRMEEDNARAAAQGPKQTVDDAKEEENYGEEVQEDED